MPTCGYCKVCRFWVTEETAIDDDSWGICNVHEMANVYMVDVDELETLAIFGCVCYQKRSEKGGIIIYA